MTFDEGEIGQKLGKYKIIDTDQNFIKKQNYKVDVIIAVGKPNIRNSIASKYEKNKYINFPNVIDQNTRLCDDLIIGRGNIISYGTFISQNVKINDFNFFNWYSTIDARLILIVF